MIQVFKLLDTGAKLMDRKFLLVCCDDSKPFPEHPSDLHLSNSVKIKKVRNNVMRLKLILLIVFLLFFLSKVELSDLNCEKIPIEENRTLFLSNFFTNTRITEFSKLLSKYQLRKSLLVSPIQFR